VTEKPDQKANKPSLGDSSSKFGLYMTLPAQIAVTLLVLFPFFASVYLSLTTWDPLTGGQTKWYQAYTCWSWFSQYGNLFIDSDFLLALLRTAVIVGIAIPIELALGFILAYLFLDKFPCKKILHSTLLMPMMIVPAVSGFIFYMLFQSNGAVNAILSKGLFTKIELTWLSGGVTAMACVIMAEVWQWTPMMFLILLGGLMAMPEDQIKAAEILGATKFQRFKTIMLPQLKPVIVIALIIRGIECIKIFDPIWIMTAGGPGTATESISVYMYKLSMKHFQWSKAAAAGLLMVILISVISVYAMKPMQRTREGMS
jgi:multiple sugar transport system permease protein